MSQDLLISKENKIATVTINRPEMGNALTSDFYGKLTGAMNELGADDEVNAIVITGAGKHFSAGGDIQGMKAKIEEKKRTGKVSSSRLTVRATADMGIAIRRCPKPTIAMINGAAAGAGCSVALACDFRVVQPSSKFVMAFINVGFCGDSCGLYFLQRLIGTARMTEMMMTGNQVKGEEAFRIGLANRLAEEGKLAETAYELANFIAAKPGFALRKQKELINEFFYSDLDVYAERETDYMVACGQTDDYVEAVYAFLEKRKPNFKGR